MMSPIGPVSRVFMLQFVQISSKESPVQIVLHPEQTLDSSSASTFVV